jgi:ribonuclease BN (tRNA processing enzyme)
MRSATTWLSDVLQHARAERSCKAQLMSMFPRCRGHTHIDEVAAHAEAFRHNEALLLIHFSMRCGKASDDRLPSCMLSVEECGSLLFARRQM